MSEFGPGAWTERIAATCVPAAYMIGNPSRFLNIYVPQVETILLDESAVEPQDVTLRIRRGVTRSLYDYASDPRKVRKVGFGALPRLVMERVADGPVLRMGERLVYDARWVHNGNVAHLVGHHLARLGYAKAKLGVGRTDCIVILEKNSPRVSHGIFDMIGYETCETNRAVEARILEIDMNFYEPYPLAPYVAEVEPAGLPTGGEDKIFIARRSSRRLINESEISALLQQRGYKTFYFEEIPLRSQWSLVRDARSIVSIHGAALGHLCAKGRGGARSDYRLLEIFSPGLVADIYRKVTAMVGGHWIGCRGRLTSEFVRRVEESESFRAHDAMDFHLDPQALERAFAMLDRAPPAA